MSGNAATTAPATATQAPTPAERDANRIRFETELEVRTASPTADLVGLTLTGHGPRARSLCSAWRTRSTSNVGRQLLHLQPRIGVDIPCECVMAVAVGRPERNGC